MNEYTIKAYFTNKQFDNVEFGVYLQAPVGFEDDTNTRNEAFSALQQAFPATWHDWTLEEMVAI